MKFSIRHVCKKEQLSSYSDQKEKKKGGNSFGVLLTYDAKPFTSSVSVPFLVKAAAYPIRAKNSAFIQCYTEFGGKHEITSTDNSHGGLTQFEAIAGLMHGYKTA